MFFSYFTYNLGERLKQNKMRDFNYQKLEKQKWDNEIVSYISLIHEYKARQEIFLNRREEDFKRLIEVSKIQSIEASNEIEGIRTTSTRLKQIINEKISAKNRDEEEIEGYRDVLNLIHENYKYIPINTNYILQLHKILFSYSSKSIGGNFKNVQNYISATDSNGNSYMVFKPLSPFETAPAIEKICTEYNEVISKCVVDPLILISIFIHDFLCIHPFLDGNGRMSRLLSVLLLYRSGFTIGKYISIEAKIAKTKSCYYDSLEQSQKDWLIGKDKSESFIKYFLGVISSAYRDLEERIEIVSSKSLAVEAVKKAISNIVGKFNKSKISELCPNLSLKSIEKALKELCDENFIKKEGLGKKTYYVKT